MDLIVAVIVLETIHSRTTVLLTDLARGKKPSASALGDITRLGRSLARACDRLVVQRPEFFGAPRPLGATLCDLHQHTGALIQACASGGLASALSDGAPVEIIHSIAETILTDGA